eukprot:gi/632954981/ref/XP_007893246.1/ PREDICTED: kinesin-like protein KIFC2 [Callorhinchus milii]
MYAFYSLLVYIFYTLFKANADEEEENGGTVRDEGSAEDQGYISMDTKTRPGRDESSLSSDEQWTEWTDAESPSDSDGLGDSDDGWLAANASSPLSEFLALKQEAAGGAFAQLDKETLNSKPPQSHLLSVMSHLLTFLEQYSNMQRLQEKAAQYKARLLRQEALGKQREKELRRAYRQKVRDKCSLIQSLQDVVSDQQSLVCKLQEERARLPDNSPPSPSSSLYQTDAPLPTANTPLSSAFPNPPHTLSLFTSPTCSPTSPSGSSAQSPSSSAHSPCPFTSTYSCAHSPCPPLSSPVGVHRLVESISSLQSERSKLMAQLTSVKQELEYGQKEREKLTVSFQLQISDLNQQIKEREEAVAQLRMESGVTDSEKRIQHLTMENESLKQSLGLTQGLLQQITTVPAQPSALLLKENEELRGKVWRLESNMQSKLEELVRMEGQLSDMHWRKEAEIQGLDQRMRGLELELEKQREKPMEIQYVTQMVEVESPTTLRSLRECEERNRHLLEQVTHQGERCCQLEHQLRSSQETSSQLKYKIVAYEAEIEKLSRELRQEISHLEASKEEAVREASQCSEKHLDQLREQFSGIQQRLTTMQPFLRSMKSDYNSLRSQVKSFSQFYEAAIIEAKKQMCSAVAEACETSRDTEQRYQKEIVLRKKYHNQLVELRGNIRVLCRIKPLIQTDKKEEDTPTPVTLNPANDCRITVLYKARERSFELDKVFIPEATQEVVFEEIEPLVTSCIDGYNICIFAYGQTGSGKTYTMEGETDNPGINQRALRALFKEIETRTGTWSYTVSLNLVEIYNEHLRDLLGKDPQEKLEIKLNPDGSGHLHVPGLTLVEVKRFQDIRKVLALGRKNRVTQSTNMNERSSRSHVLLTVTVSGTEINTDTKTVGKMNLVDLAGSERVWKSGAEGERLKEAQNINKSLLALADVIQALRAKQNHVPFRNSKLTYLLQDSLGKGNKTVMVVQISSLEENVGETMCSLKFAQRVCKVELGPAARRVEATS